MFKTFLPVLSKVHQRCLYNQIYDKIDNILSKYETELRKRYSGQYSLLAMFENEKPSRVKINSSLRSSQQGCSIKRAALRNFTKFTGKHQCQSLFINKVPRLRQLYLKKESSTGIFL